VDPTAPLIEIATGDWRGLADWANTQAWQACDAALFRAYAGDRDTSRCAVQDALVGDPAGWAGQLAWQTGATDVLLQQLELPLGLSDVDTPEQVFAPPVQAWLAFVGNKPTQARHAMRAWIDIELGDHAAARGEIAQLSDPDVRAHLAEKLGRHEGSVRALGDDQPLWYSLKSGTRVAECDARISAAIVSVQSTGDAGSLADALATCDAENWDVDELVIAIAGCVTKHREQLAAALRVRPFQSHGLAVSLLLADAAGRRDAALLVGDGIEAARWQAIVQRQAKVLEDPRKVIALLVLHL
jgi:hypothetical protein